MTGYSPPSVGSTAWGGPLNAIIAEIDTDMQNTAVDADVVHNSGDEAITGIKTFASAPVVPNAAFSIAKVALLQSNLDSLASGNGRSREDITYTTASLAADASESGTVALPLGYNVYRVEVSRAARVRLYATTAQRDADTARAFGAIPTGDHGLVMDVLITSADTLDITPAIPGQNMDTGNVAIRVTNEDVTTGTVAVTITYIRTE